MTTTEIARVEEAEVKPLNKTEARKLDKQIRSKSDQTVSARDKTINLFDELTELLTKAKQGQIHKALDIKSWPAYVADAVSIPVAPEREDRKVLVQFLSGQGMSQRAIAATLNTSQKTVDRDLDGEEAEEGATVTSLDGAERPKNKPEIIDAEVVDDEADSDDVPDKPMTAAEIVDNFGEEMTNLWNAHAELVELTHEDKWAGARKRIIKADLNHLGDIVAALQTIVDDLMAE